MRWEWDAPLSPCLLPRIVNTVRFFARGERRGHHVHGVCCIRACGGASCCSGLGVGPLTLVLLRESTTVSRCLLQYTCSIPVAGSSTFRMVARKRESGAVKQSLSVPPLTHCSRTSDVHNKLLQAKVLSPLYSGLCRSLSSERELKRQDKCWRPHCLDVIIYVCALFLFATIFHGAPPQDGRRRALPRPSEPRQSDLSQLPGGGPVVSEGVRDGHLRRRGGRRWDPYVPVVFPAVAHKASTSALLPLLLLLPPLLLLLLLVFVSCCFRRCRCCCCSCCRCCCRYRVSS